MIMRVNLGENSYDIIIERGCLNKVGSLLDLNRKVFIITDDGVPVDYSNTLSSASLKPYIMTVNQGEASKCETVLFDVLSKMLDFGLSRKDCVVAVGGGVVGDLAGFAASIYMRGIDFYNIPTTLLSQVDSSVGGKTAIDLNGVKNIVGTFYQPKKVLIDTSLLETLSQRQFSAGLAESIKMAATFDEDLFSLIEEGGARQNIDKIVPRSINIKRLVVEEDEKEHGLRSVLNFGHTLGHGIESEQKGALLHGECIAMGMLPFCSVSARKRLKSVLEEYNLPTEYSGDKKKAMEAILHDKKASDGGFRIITVNEIGSYEIEYTNAKKLTERLNSL